jgi:hypothetical protein
VATDQLTAAITCPACQQRIAIPTTARHTGHRQAVLTVDTSAVRAHTATHTEDQTMTDAYDRREAMSRWLAANGIDPDDVPLHADVTVDTGHDGRRVILYEAFQRGSNGSILVSDDGTSAAVEERTTPLTTEPPVELASYVDPPRTR